MRKVLAFGVMALALVAATPTSTEIPADTLEAAGITPEMVEEAKTTGQMLLIPGMSYNLENEHGEALTVTVTATLGLVDAEGNEFYACENLGNPPFTSSNHACGGNPPIFGYVSSSQHFGNNTYQAHGCAFFCGVYCWNPF